tara:strand:- start:141 stop:365 length:225 start_codon:yes stop_codon:yes gene_type:complete
MSRTTKHPNEFPKWRMMRMGNFKNRQAEQEDREREERFRKRDEEQPTLDSLKATAGQISRAGDRLRKLLNRRKK